MMERGQEQQAEAPLLYERPELSQQLLGFPVETLYTLDPEKFSEREAIAHETSQIVSGYRDRLVSATKVAGITLSQQEIDQWQPSEQDLLALRNETRGPRRRLQMLEGVREYMANEGLMSQLRPIQRDSMQANRYMLEFGERNDNGVGKSMYDDMPTGTGKTGGFVHFVRALKYKEDPDDPIRVNVLVPTVQILNQTIGRADKAIDRKGFGKFAPRLQVGAYYQQRRELDKPVVVMTNASFNNLADSGQLPDFDVTVVDEVHTGLGDSISDNLRRYMPNRLTLGFTATPDYSDEKQVAMLLKHRAFHYPLDQAIRTGKLAPVTAELRSVHPAIDFDDLPEDANERKRAIDGMYLNARLQDAMPDILQAVRNGIPVLVRCPPGGDIASARFAAEQLAKQIVTTRADAKTDVKRRDLQANRRVRAFALGGSRQKLDEQLFIMQEYNNRRVDVLTYVDLINMGADLPVAKLFVNLAPVRASRVEMVQGIGRVLRLQLGPNGKPSEARIIDYEAADAQEKGQYTVLDALNLEPGRATRIGKARETSTAYYNEAPTPYYIPELPTIESIRLAAGSLVLNHDEDVVYDPVVEVEDDVEVEVEDVAGEPVDEAPVPAPEAATPQKTYSLPQACEWFGNTEVTVRSILVRAGYDPTKALTQEDLDLLATEYDELHIEELPEEGYIAVETVRTSFGDRRSLPMFVKALRDDGFEITRFRKDGRVSHYMQRSNVRLPGDM